MKYAIISDIHGNSFALEAVIKDAREQAAEAYIFLGDYCSALPWSNQVVDMIRSLENKTVICGNGEGYFSDLKDQDQATWIHKQLMPMYWTYRSLTEENLFWLLSLPQSATITDGTRRIHMSHSSDIFINRIRLRPFRSSSYGQMMRTSPFSHEEYLAIGRKAVLEYRELKNAILDLPTEIYLNGHNHLQFYMEYAGRTFINPGSCGASVDFSPAASYTILNLQGGHKEILERRVDYDVDAVSEKLMQSDYASKVPVWAEIARRQLLEAEEYTAQLLWHLRDVCQSMGVSAEMPVSNEVWDEAMKTWDINDLH